jgi:quinol monooxygenase YgiN
LDGNARLVQTGPGGPLRERAHEATKEVPGVLNVIATLRVKEGKEQEARAFLKELASKVQESEPETLAYICHQRKDDPRTFVVYEKYKSDEAFRTHGANLAQHGARFAGILDGRPEILMLDEI